MLGGHRSRLTHEEQDRNKDSGGKRAKAADSDFQRLRKSQGIVQLHTQVANRALELFARSASRRDEPLHEFYDKLEEAAAICRRLAAEADDPAEAQAMSDIVAAIEQAVELAKEEGLFFP